MCECDENPPSCSASTRRTARKEHRCHECGHAIQPGERYQIESGIWDGAPASFKWCADCATVAAVCESLGDFCFCFGQLREAAGEFLRGAA
jgi:hypothetical protein